MTNTTRRAVACLVGLALLGLLVAIVLPKQSSTEVVTGDDTTQTTPGTTAPATTAVPETTTAASTTTTVAPATTVVETTVPPTTVAPEPPTSEPAPPTMAAAAVEPQAAPIPEAVQPEQPQGAVRVETGKCVSDEATCHPPSSEARAEWATCEEWHDLAAAVGWPESDGHTLSFVISRESGCNPNAHNPSGATGLMQIIGGCAPYGSCYDPEANLRRGLDMRRERGWQPWQVCGFRRNC